MNKKVKKSLIISGAVVGLGILATAIVVPSVLQSNSKENGNKYYEDIQKYLSNLQNLSANKKYENLNDNFNNTIKVLNELINSKKPEGITKEDYLKFETTKNKINKEIEKIDLEIQNLNDEINKKIGNINDLSYKTNNQIISEKTKNLIISNKNVEDLTKSLANSISLKDFQSLSEKVNNQYSLLKNVLDFIATVNKYSFLNNDEKIKAQDDFINSYNNDKGQKIANDALQLNSQRTEYEGKVNNTYFAIFNSIQNNLKGNDVLVLVEILTKYQKELQNIYDNKSFLWTSEEEQKIVNLNQKLTNEYALIKEEYDDNLLAFNSLKENINSSWITINTTNIEMNLVNLINKINNDKNDLLSTKYQTLTLEEQTKIFELFANLNNLNNQINDFINELNKITNLTAEEINNYQQEFSLDINKKDEILSKAKALSTQRENEKQILENKKNNLLNSLDNEYKNLFTQHDKNIFIQNINNYQFLDEYTENWAKLLEAANNLKNTYNSNLNITKESDYNKYTDDSKNSYETKNNEVFTLLNHEFSVIIQNNQSWEELINNINNKNSELVNIAVLLVEKEINAPSHNNKDEEKIREVNENIMLTRNSINDYESQNFFVANFSEDLNLIEDNFSSSTQDQNAIEKYTNQINELKTKINDFIAEAKSIPTNYSNLTINFTPLVPYNSGNYLVEKNSDFSVKLNLIYNNKEYSLRYLKQHNIVVRYFIDAPSGVLPNYVSVEDKDIDYANGTATLKFAHNDNNRKALRMVLRYNGDVNNSATVAKNSPLTYLQGVDPEPSNIDPLSVDDYRLLPKYYNSLTNISNIDNKTLNLVLNDNWNKTWSNRFSDKKELKYNDMLWVTFLKFFIAANFENNNFTNLTTKFTSDFNEQGSFTFRADAIAAKDLTNHKFNPLGGSFFITVLDSISYQNKFNIGANDKISFVFSVDNSQSWDSKHNGTDKPEIINNNDGDLSVIPAKYNVVGKYPIIANFYGVINFQLLINDEVKLSVKNTDANQLKTFPIFIIRKSGSEVIFYSKSEKATINS